MNYLKTLVEDIHSVVVATIDENSLPTTRVIDMMLHDEYGAYFLTAKGKAFYKQLMDKGYISLSGMTSGKDTMVKKAISIAGSVRNIGSEKLDDIFAKNTYMQKIYPTQESRTALEVFCLYKGQGEFFDLSTSPITRTRFSLGGAEVINFAYSISDSCNACGLCLKKCPSSCIIEGNPFVINQEHCLHCGNCKEICTEGAVMKGITT